MTQTVDPHTPSAASFDRPSTPIADRFADRHNGVIGDDRATMLNALGYDSLSSLLHAAVPASIAIETVLDTAIPAAASEAEALAELRSLAGNNTITTSFLGQGYYGTLTPAVIKRNVLENPSWYTAYTPYQPEISQGRLEALINFQTMVAQLTGLEIANSSMLDESTAVVEAMMVARRASKHRSNRFVVSTDAFVQTLALLRGRAEAVGIELVEADLSAGVPSDLGDDYFGAFVQYPAASGAVVNPTPVIEAAHAAGALVVVATDLLALTVLESPGKLGADIAVGSSQRFGVPMGFGGPHAGFLAVHEKVSRQMPGRLVGVSKDAFGRPAYRLALQAREQHIRRDKATSNICTAQVLLAVMASMYAVYHGPAGLRRIGETVHGRAVQAAEALRSAGYEIVHEAFFDTLEVRVGARGRSAADIVGSARAHGLAVRTVADDIVGISFDEAQTDAEIGTLLTSVFGAEPAASASVSVVPEALERETAYLTHQNFTSFHSETAMMRYLKRLADKDYALDRGMIPLGSCTMKLNAATEMEAVTWPEFAGLHPHAPEAEVAGSLELIDQLERWLAEVTGYDSVSLQPNAGSQGELAGLMAIRSYHRSRGDLDRTICLIPQSAHGTNAASAVLAGMRVSVIATDSDGNVDVDDLVTKIADAGDQLAALMVTYPSTHGVYEERIREVCELVHDAGGQVYVDGANLNALLGYAQFGDFGGDISHLNLHKTFCIPHGGGGPGVGPVAAKAHLAPFLPGHPYAQRTDHALRGGGTVEHGGIPISAAAYGSPSILPISWAYIRMMGAAGLKEATGVAVLSANYIAKRLEDYYPVLYRGENGLVAHECIVDVRPLTAATGVTVDDIAKRLIDYGFHAPTMSFPVAGTLMIEPTESEDLAEIERFIDAMILIHAEAKRVGAGEWSVTDNPLRNAPHTAESITDEEWAHPYSRRQAVYPFAAAEGADAKWVSDRIAAKYWPPVARVDNAYGDRNLVCDCPPPEAFAS